MRDVPEIEEWRAIEGYPDYAVSDLGHVKRLTSRTCAKAGHILKTPLRTKKGLQAYPAVDLCRDGKRRTFSVHQLVATAFLGPCPPGLEVNHKNTNKADPRAKNLEYATSSANQLHAYAHGLQSAVGEDNGQAILTEVNVKAIKAVFTGTRGQQTRLAETYGVSATTIRDIVRGRTWTHI